MIFQSTPSVWRETRCEILSVDTSGISIHSLRVEGDPTHNCSLSHTLDFNPLPPCGGRLFPANTLVRRHRFQSTPSVWRETMANKRKKGGGYIFQSTPSVWRETFCCTAQIYCLVFQSTPSVWRETIVDIRTRDPLVFQSTPSVWRETTVHAFKCRCRLFQSTPSVWRETIGRTSIAR